MQIPLLPYLLLTDIFADFSANEARAVVDHCETIYFRTLVLGPQFSPQQPMMKKNYKKSKIGEKNKNITLKQ